jgi:hypothetical protein
VVGVEPTRPKVAAQPGFALARCAVAGFAAAGRRVACRAEARGSIARLRPSGYGAAAFTRCASEGWCPWPDLNQHAREGNRF